VAEELELAVARLGRRLPPHWGNLLALGQLLNLYAKFFFEGDTRSAPATFRRKIVNFALESS
jgi:hypothetical protein